MANRLLFQRTASELAHLLATREVSSVEIVESLIDRADEVEPKVHALTHQLRESALTEAATSDAARARGDALGPLAGIPISIKESVETAGLASTMGYVSRREEVAREDAVTVQVARGVGA